MTEAMKYVLLLSIIVGISPSLVSSVRYRLCRHEGGQVVKCWKDQRCQDVLNHNPTYESNFFEFVDSCYGSGSKSCFISRSSKVKCEIIQQSVKNRFGGRDKVVGFDLENHKIIIPVTPPSSDQQTNGINQEKDLQKTNIILGLRRIPQNTTQRTIISDSSLGYSDYDDTDLNPNIFIKYLNRKIQNNNSSLISETYKKGDLNMIKLEETTKHENKVGNDATIPDTTPILSFAPEVQITSTKVSLLSFSSTTSPLKTFEDSTPKSPPSTSTEITSPFTTGTSNTQSTTAKKDKTTGAPHKNILPSDADINYILNILDLQNVSNEYKSRKYIQSRLQNK